MTELHPDPIGDAGHKAAQLAQIVIMAAEAAVVIAAARTRAAAERDEQAARTISTELAANHKAASDLWSPVLADHHRGRLDVAQTLAAWSSAQAWRLTDASADRASDLAEGRLHELRPSAMTRYDDLRRQGLDPVESMRQVVPLLENNARTGQAGPLRYAVAGVAHANPLGATAPAHRPANDGAQGDLSEVSWNASTRQERATGAGGDVVAASQSSGLPKSRARDSAEASRASFPDLTGAVTTGASVSTVVSRYATPRAASAGSTQRQ